MGICSYILYQTLTLNPLGIELQVNRSDAGYAPGVIQNLTLISIRYPGLRARRGCIDTGRTP
jgi:hypothetical protein